MPFAHSNGVAKIRSSGEKTKRFRNIDLKCDENPLRPDLARNALKARISAADVGAR